MEIFIIANPKREIGFYLASNPYLKKIKLRGIILLKLKLSTKSKIITPDNPEYAIR
jgi:hypothetical protein